VAEVAEVLGKGTTVPLQFAFGLAVHAAGSKGIHSCSYWCPRVRTRAVQSVGARNRGGRGLVLVVVTTRHVGAYRLSGSFKRPDVHPIRGVSQGDLKVASYETRITRGFICLHAPCNLVKASRTSIDVRRAFFGVMGWWGLFWRKQVTDLASAPPPLPSLCIPSFYLRRCCVLPLPLPLLVPCWCRCSRRSCCCCCCCCCCWCRSC
jgi:hypothetical protein